MPPGDTAVERTGYGHGSDAGVSEQLLQAPAAALAWYVCHLI
ncbi:hypothetical protein [Dysgonomonas sp. GY75]|nr:hypothetical protein [Dysgonomonas sp. GY75]